MPNNLRTSRKVTEKRRKRRNRTLFLSLVVICVIAVSAAYAFYPFDSSIEDKEADPPAEEVINPEKEEDIELSIVCVGDVMVHRSQIASQYNREDGSYNYDNNFEYVKKYIEEADLALCNVETTFAGGTPSGYPSFNAPDALADSLARAGFDVAITSNNHLYDKGYAGMERTLRILREAGLATTGTRLPWEKNYTIMDVKDLKIAVVAYTYETPSYNGRKTINGIQINSDAEELINSFNYDTLDEDLKKVEATIAEARSEGADIVVCYYHWGEEYQRSPNEWQRYIAKKTVDMGIDIIYASHPHVLQTVEMITNENTGKEVPVFYSMGNFISNQRLETLNNRFTEQGMIARVSLKYSVSTGEIVDMKMDAMRTWVNKYRKASKDVYAIIPLDENFENNESLITSGNLNRAIQASQDVAEVLGSDYIWE
jgi:poly-gamma-glutamate capsule biosynthesis protein CapA/YwtB (metallophosphatase superfamily)